MADLRPGKDGPDTSALQGMHNLRRLAQVPQDRAHEAHEQSVQVGIGGWYGSRQGLKVALERETTVLTAGDVEELGVERAAEIALELAWKDCAAGLLSLDIDVVDAGITPATGSLEPGGLLPREMLKFIRPEAKEGLCGMEVVEICPPHDVSDMTAQLGCRAIADVLGEVDARHIGSGQRNLEQPSASREPRSRS